MSMSKIPYTLGQEQAPRSSTSTVPEEIEIVLNMFEEENGFSQAMQGSLLGYGQ